MNLYKKAALFGAIVCAAVFFVGAGSGKFTVAFVDMTRALNEVGEGKVELGKLEGWQAAKRDDLAKKEKDLMDRKEKLQSEEATLSQDAYKAKVEIYLKDVEAFQKDKMAAAKDLQDKLANATVYVKRRMDLIISEMAEKNGYDMVVDITEGGVVYFPSSMDITNEIIREYDKRYPASSSDSGKSKDKKKK